jgi:hypothetical protein
MRTHRIFIASLVVAFVVLSALAYLGAPQHIATGTIGEVEAGHWIAVASERTDPNGFQIALRDTTIYEGDRASLKPGVRVTVWYRSVGERRFVADRVRVLPVATTR